MCAKFTTITKHKIKTNRELTACETNGSGHPNLQRFLHKHNYNNKDNKFRFILIKKKKLTYECGD